MIVALWDRAKLAEDSAVDDSGGWGGVTLAYNTRSPGGGGRGHRRGRRRRCDDRPGVRADLLGRLLSIDPEGHPWEVALAPSTRAER